MSEQRARRSVCLLFALFAFFSLAFIFTPDTRFFAYENRYLQQFPTFSWANVRSGQFTQQFETYVSDQFPQRQLWLQLKGVSERAIGKAENNGVYFGSDNWLFETLTLDSARWQANTTALVDFQNWMTTNLPETDFQALIVPPSSLLYPQSLPAFSSSTAVQEALTALKQALPQAYTDVLPALRAQSEEQLYFQTDHHWTQRGAFYGYEALAHDLNFSPLPADFWHWQAVSDTFYGSYYPKASVPFYRPDEIEVAYSPTPLTYTNLETNESEPLYSTSFLNRHDQYGFFLNGTPSFSRIENPDAPNQKRLVILKDSFSHVIAPLLAEHYASVTLIDLRFFNRSLQTYLQAEQFDTVLFLAGATTFNTNMQLNKLGA